MTVAYDATGGGNTGFASAPTPASATWTHTATGSNLAVVVVAFVEADGTASATCTYNGISMTLLGSQNSNNVNYNTLVFGILNPPAGAQTVVVSGPSTGASINIVGANSVSFTGVGSFGTFGSTFGSGASLTESITANSDGYIVQAFHSSATSALTSYTGGTSRYSALVPITGYAVVIGTAPGTGSSSAFSATGTGGSIWAGVATPLVAYVPPTPGTVSYDATGGGNSTNSTSPVNTTWSHTCTGSNRAVIVGVSVVTSAPTPVSASCTYNGVAMTQIGAMTENNSGLLTGLFFFGLLNPPTGAQTVSVTGSGSGGTSIAGNSISFSNVASFGTAVIAFGSGTSLTESITASATGYIAQGFLTGDSSVPASYNQTSRYSRALDASLGHSMILGTAAGTGSATSFTATTSSGNWAAVGVPMVAVALTTGAFFSMF